ncbi:hypothetical protein PUMCH_000788 [Australozyma saopauloensis]|uniref:ER membrane protein complex subunit 3 n=1 Tax=Australozyma saopauloensis TaxID=291208 RepID=A0AAX4H6C3_9ASCO|nr:hypothetical protein PUMCH_000788 [[Candida] saopauloensis]
MADLQGDSYLSEQSKATGPANPFTDPGTNDALLGMVKGNLMNFVPQTLILAWVNFFFSDSIVMKLPFPLTSGFKAMLQSGVNTPDLDVRYVSAISWYFVNLVGLRPVYSFIMSDPDKALQLVNSQQQQTPVISGPGAPKMDKLFKAEAESVQIVLHEPVYTNIASRMLKKYERN